jgi:multidrug resistance efflux pump
LPLQVGAVVSEGAALCTLIPSGELKVVAEFSPGNTLGRVRPGQSARVQLEGFPWPRYGSLEATVSGVASEVREGLLRVELRLRPDTHSPIPLQHGLPGRVEVELERASPAVLVLRAAGRRLSGDAGGHG